MANLPTVGSDTGIWGSELNTYLLVGHDANGHHQTLYSVREYGASGNGVTDDTVAIQAAITAAQNAGGGIVFLPTGTYVVSASLLITADNIQVIGAGWGAVLAPTAALANLPVIWVQQALTTAYRYGIRFADFYLNGNNVTGIIGLQLDTTYHAEIQHVRVRFCPGKGIYLNSPVGNLLGAYTHVLHCVVGDGGAGHGIETNNHEFNTIELSLFNWQQTAGGVAIDLHSGSNVILGNTFDECDTSIACNSFTFQQTILGNQFDRGLTRFILVSSVKSGVVIEGNFFGEFAGTGAKNMIDVSGGSNHDNIIRGNYASVFSAWTTFITEAVGTGVPGNRYEGNNTGGLPIVLVSGIARNNAGFNPVKPLPTPAAPVPTTTTTGGTIAAGVYGVEITYVNAFGETLASVNGPITTTGATSKITIPAPPVIGNATGWYAYVTQVNGAIFTRQQTAGAPTSLNSSLVLTAPPTNTGANPPGANTTAGFTQPSVPATGVAFTNTFGVDCTVYVTGGTVTGIAIGGLTTGATSGAFRVQARETITLTYSVAPTWQWFGD